MAFEFVNFPRQQLPFSRKTEKWRRQCVDWADSKTLFSSSLVRNSVIHKKINYDLINGKLHMEDLQLTINPAGMKAPFVPEKIQHYPTINGKMEVLIGEENSRVFDYRVVVTNPNAVSEIEENKKEALFQDIMATLQQESQSEEEFQSKLESLNQYYTYEWQDIREIRANALLNHYSKEQEFKIQFSQGFKDAMIVGEEIYQCDIIGGEPVLQKLNPMKVRIFKSGYSNQIEDADIIIIEDYLSPGKIIDMYYEDLTEKDIKYLEELPDTIGETNKDSMDNVDPRAGFVYHTMVSDTFNDGFYFDPLNETGMDGSLLPYDLQGNVRVLKVYWKSRRKIKKVKSYDLETGEVTYNFYPETYVLNEALGEEEEIFFINEAWEGTKIGEKIYVNIRPRVVQYNSLTNPSKCHFGIIGQIYNMGDDKPFSLVDRLKPYSYLYDAIHDRLNKLIAQNWGKIVQLDLAKIPEQWTVEKWLYYATVNRLAITDSFNEGKKGASTGKLAGALNNASSGVIDAELGNSIQSYLNILEFIKIEMGEVSGINRQREGQIANRETVGGIERATLQSSYITEWLFIPHESVKKRVMECFLETAKVALRGRNKKFPYLLPDFALKMVDIDGDEFAECDYGLVVDNSESSQKLNQQIEGLAQAALQNQALNFSTIMKLYGTASLAEKQRFVQNAEMEQQQRVQQEQQMQMQQQQESIQAQMQMQQAEMQQKDTLNERDNETKIMVAQINAQARIEDDNDGVRPDSYSQEAKEKLLESMRQFNEKLKLEREKLSFLKSKQKEDAEIKRKSLNRKPIK